MPGGFRGAVLVACAVLVVTGWIGMAKAQDEDQGPIVFSADQLTHDRELGITRASGNVEVTHGGRILIADTITYNQPQDLVTATGNISLAEPTGEVLFAEHMELTGDLRAGIIEDLRAVLADGARFAAAGARRTAGVETEMRNAVYSPCNLCPDDPTRPPLWQIKAIKVLHDQRTRRIEYTDAWLEIAGVPVAYTPFFAHPDLTVKRKTGLLAPSIGNSSDLGFVFQAPFFWVIAPNIDTTITPIVTSKEGPVLDVEYRHALRGGYLEMDTSITEDSSNDVRGHLFGSFRHDIDDTWRMGIDANGALDDTYLRRYQISSDQTLTSRLFAEGFRRRNYAVVNAYAFQGLRATNDQDTIPLALPMIDFNHVGEADRFGGRTSLDVNLLALHREQGVDSRRLSVTGGWRLPLRGRIGDIYTLSAAVQGDVYHVANQPVPGQAGTFTGVTGRIVPHAGLEWRWPLVKGGGRVHQVVEPIGEFVVSPYGGNPSDIPNEDSQDLEFDETNLFGFNRFTGLDRVEGGPRVNYGLCWGIYGSGGGSTTVFVGQSYRLKTDDTFAVGSGLEDHFSDVVTALNVSPGEAIDVTYRARFDSTDLSPRRHELNTTLGVEAFNLSTRYVFFDRQQGSEFAGREEIAMSLRSQLSRHWSTELSGVRDFAAGGGMRSAGIDITYEDECVKFSVDLTRTFFVDRDVEPTDAILFRVTLKTLGEVGTGIERSN